MSLRYLVPTGLGKPVVFLEGGKDYQVSVGAGA